MILFPVFSQRGGSREKITTEGILIYDPELLGKDKQQWKDLAYLNFSEL